MDRVNEILLPFWTCPMTLDSWTYMFNDVLLLEEPSCGSAVVISSSCIETGVPIEDEKARSRM